MYAVFRTGSHLSAKTRVLVDHLLSWFAGQRGALPDQWAPDRPLPS
jgi:hypothetical protein